MKLITKETLEKWDACKDCYDKFNELLPEGADLQTASKVLIDAGRNDYSDWLWGACKKDKDYIDQTYVTAGDWGTASAGEYGTASAGYRGTASAGEYGTASAGDRGTASAGEYGTASAGDWGTASAGEYGTASAGYDGTASAGDWGTASAGYDGTASAGDYGAIVIEYHDGQNFRKKVGAIGENGLKANTFYRIENGEFVEVKK